MSSWGSVASYADDGGGGTKTRELAEARAALQGGEEDARFAAQELSDAIDEGEAVVRQMADLKRVKAGLTRQARGGFPKRGDNYQQRLREHMDVVDQVISEVNGIDSRLKGLRTQLSAGRSKMNVLQAACGAALRERDELAARVSRLE